MTAVPSSGLASSMRLALTAAALGILGPATAVALALALVLQTGTGEGALGVVRTVLGSAALLLVGRRVTRSGLARGAVNAPWAAWLGLLAAGVALTALLPGRLLLGSLLIDRSFLAAVVDFVLWNAIAALGVLWGQRSDAPRPRRAAYP